MRKKVPMNKAAPTGVHLYAATEAEKKAAKKQKPKKAKK